MDYIVRDLDITSHDDAIKMLSLLKGMDDSWPGGFLRGSDYPLERMVKDIQQSKMLFRLVVEHEGQFVAYTDVARGEDEGSELAYIGLLGARLEHHGKGLGKRLLCEVIRRTSRMGFKQITLHTWPGNLKAVPLYKKCGFFWVPDTEVYMRNFLPSVLALSQSMAFFADRDWYSCLKRDLSLVPDEMLCGSVKVYEYLFKDAHGMLKVTYDARGFGLTAIETDKYSVSCSLEREELSPGEISNISWSFTSKTGQKMQASIISERNSELDLQFEEHISFDGSAVVTKQLTLSAHALPLRSDRPSRQFASTVIIEGVTIQMGAGVHVARALDIRHGGSKLTPLVPTRVKIPIHNQTDRLLKGTVLLIPDSNLKLSVSEFNFEIEPRMGFDCETTIVAGSEGVWPCKIISYSDTTRSERTLWYRSGSIAPIAWKDEYADSCHMVFGSSSTAIAVYGGNLDLSCTGSTSPSIQQNMPVFGPPFLEESVVDKPVNVEIRNNSNRVSVLSTCQVPGREGVKVVRESSFISEGVLRIKTSVLNESADPVDGQVKILTSSEVSGMLSVPIEQHLLQGSIVEGEFPSEFEDYGARNNVYGESWISTEEKGNVVGIIWLGNMEVHPPPYWSSLPALLSPSINVMPGKSVEIGDMLLVNTTGNWTTVRNIWKQFQPDRGDLEESMTIRPIREVKTDHSPLVTLLNDLQTPITLNVDQASKHSGKLELTASKFRIEPSFINFENVNRSHPLTFDAHITTHENVGAEKVSVNYQSNAVVDTLYMFLIKAGDVNRQIKSMESEDQIRVNNGLLEFVVSSKHLGGITSLKFDGKENVYSSYPEPHPFRYSNPWYGGIHPYLNESVTDTTLTREQFTSAPIVVTGTSGLEWTGVKVTCMLTHKNWKWLKVEVDYLTLPGSNLVALRTRWINTDSASHKLHGGMAVWAMPDGQKASTGLWEANDAIVERMPYRFGTNSPEAAWVAAEHTDSKKAMLVISQHNNGGSHMEDMDTDGRCLFTSRDNYLKPGKTFETIDWLIILSNRTQIEAYCSLASLKELP